MSYQTNMQEFRSTDPVASAISRLGMGGIVIVTDADDRENEADLVMAAEFVTTQQMAFIVRHSTGIVCLPMTAARCDALRLPQMVAENSDSHETAFTVSVDAIGTGTGVSAMDRGCTARLLANPETTSDELRRPGHMFPLRARSGGVLERAGHTEAAVDLLGLAGLSKVGLIAELVGDDGAMLRGYRLEQFAVANGLPIVSVADVVRHRQQTESFAEAVSSSRLPTRFGDFTATVYRNRLDGVESFVLTMGEVQSGSSSSDGLLVRIHSECLSGDTFASLKCDCGDQLAQALKAISSEGCGALVYLRGHEGRGIGLGRKIRAYSLQDTGLDTVDANVALGLPVDSRSYLIGAQILADLKIRRVRLLTNNPAKSRDLEEFGIEILGNLPLHVATNKFNRRYLRTKRDRLGHHLPDDLLTKQSHLGAVAWPPS